MAAILEEGFLESLVLPADLESVEGLPLDQLCHLGLAHANIKHLPLGPHSKLRSLDLYAAGLTNLPQLPDSIQWLDLRASSLARDPESYPEGLEHLGTDAYRVTEQTRFPAGIRSLAFNFAGAEGAPLDSELMSRIRRKLPEELESLELKSLDDVKRLNGLPKRLRELRLDATKIQTLDGLPESLDRLSLKGSSGFKHLPRYMTELHFGSGTEPQALLEAKEAPRFLEVLTTGALAKFGSEPDTSEFSVLEDLQLYGQRTTPSTMELPWLISLNIQGSVVGLDLSNFPRLRSLSLQEIDPATLNATAKTVWNQLQRLRITKAYRGTGSLLPPSLEELDVTLAGNASLARLPQTLKKLILRLAPGETLEGLMEREGSDKSFQLPEELEHLEIHGGGTSLGNDRRMPLPSQVILPLTLKHLVLHKVDADAWAESLSELEELEAVILDDVDVSGLDWLPKSVRHLGFSQTESTNGGFRKEFNRPGCSNRQ